MANQIIVTQSGNVQVSIEPPANVQVQISRAAIGTVSNVPTANFANYAGNVTVSAQPNITSLGTLTGLTVSGNSTVNNLTVTGNLVAGNLVANSANYANFAGVANTANTVAGANVTGVVANATFATSAGTANSATVANTANSVALANVSGAGNIASINLDGNVANLLTGLGTFVAIPTVSANANYANFANIANTANSVAVANVSGIGNIATVNLDGNASNILFGNGIFSAIPAVSNVANANYANFAGTAFSVSGSNVSGEVANAAYANAANTANLATYATTANSVAGANVSGEVANAAYANAANTANLATFATTANAVAGANVSGAVAYATVANSVSVGNVSGIGNISTINIDGNLGNVLYGNGVFAAVVAPTSVANANYANFAGTAFSVAGSNVSGEVANAAYANAANTANLATYATTANSVAGANVSGTVANATFALDAGNSNLANTANSVAVANVSGIGNIATVNLDGNASNILYGNGVFATISIPAGDQISNGTSNVSIPVANGNVQVYANNQHWTFTDVGNLLLAGGNGVIQSIANSSLDPINPNVSTMVLTPDQGNSSQALVLDPTTPGHIHLRAPGSNIDQPQANVYLGGEASSFEVGVFNGAVPNLFIHSNNNTWMFDITGNLTLPANAFAINYANGTQVPLDGPVANANYANFAGTAYSVDGANVSGEVANANFASYANIATSANSVALANVSGIGNIANINLDGSSSNVLFGNGVFAPESTSIANANYANFAGTAFSVSGSNVSGEVANAAYANIAGVANSVAGANVSGTVANANYSAFANVASSANSVALANVSGIGNIANINLDGSSSNVLFGNGVFAPESTSIANANYANFAGTAFSVSGSNVSGEVANANYASYANVANTANSVAVGNVSGIGNIATINLDGNASNALLGNGSFGPVEVQSTSIANGTSNINIPVANGAIAVSVNNVANLMLLENGGVVNAFPTSSVVNMLRINTFNNSLSDAHRVAWARARGSNTSPTSVQGSDRLGILGFFGHNGTSYQTNSISLIRATVDSSYTANTANIPIGLQLIVNDTNGGVNNQAKTHNFYANGSTTLASSLNTGGDLYVAGNAQTSGALQTGGNITVYPTPLASGQANVTLYNGNLDVANNGAATGGWVNTINLRGPGNSFGALGSNGYLYGNTIRAIGAISSDDIMRLPGAGAANIAMYASNGNIITTGTVSANAANVANLTVTGVSNLGANGNVIITGGNVGQVLTTNGSGNLSWSSIVSNASSIANGTSNVSIPVANGSIAFSANNVANVVLIENGGLVNAYPTSSTVNMLRINTFNNSLSDAHRVAWARARGTNASPTSVQANDNLGILSFFGHNGTSYQTNSVGFVRARVDASYTANGANIPIGMQVVVNDTNGGINNQAKTHNFYANGYTNLSGGLSAGNLNVSDILSGNINAYLSGISAGNTFNLTLDNNQTQALLQSTYNNANIQTGAWTSWRHRGTSASPLPVQAGDEISKFSSVVRADSGNTYYSAAEQVATVISNDGAGNVATNFRTRVYGNGSQFSVMAPKMTVADTNDFGANATIYANGYIDTVSTVSAANVAVTSNGFVKLASYTEAALTAITGQIGWMAAVSDSAQGSNPNGMIAFWDTTNARWSYIHDNSAV